MSKINLLPWRDELREQKKKAFIATSVVSAMFAVLAVMLAWFYYAYQVDDQIQANQLVMSSNQSLDAQLKNIEGLKAQRNAVIERMQLIQGLEGQRPISVRLIDEIARVVPDNMYLTKMTRSGNKIIFEGKADNPNTVAELLRRLESSNWFRNAFMSSFVAAEHVKSQENSSVLPRIEASYGQFVVTVDTDDAISLKLATRQAEAVKGSS